MVDLRASSRGYDPKTPGADSASASSSSTTTMTTTTTRVTKTAQPSPRKNASGRLLPSPTSLSPTNKAITSTEPRLPPSFQPTPKSQLPPAVPSRYTGIYTPQSPYRPGEYQRSECAPSERTRIERKLFDDDDDDQTPREPVDSSPLAPAFEAKMVLRNGASVDLISWLRTNFHHQPPPYTPVTPLMSLAHVQRLLQERFPRVPDLGELHRAILAAFPHSEWEESPDGKEPPIMRGLTWHGRDVAEEDDNEATPGRTRPPNINTTTPKARPSRTNGHSRSPSVNSLMSPVSSSRRVPDTPARSVLDEFAEIATRTPLVKERSLEADRPPPAYALKAMPMSVDRVWRKRRASVSPDRSRRRAVTPDALQELLDAAEAVEGSPLTTIVRSAHKRRRTINGDYGRPPVLSLDQRRARSARGTVSPPLGSIAIPPRSISGDEDDPVSPLASEESTASQLVALGGYRRGNASSTASQLSSISETLHNMGPTVIQQQQKPTTSGRKVNELPTSTQGQHPGFDCKPPYPYHEMIRFAIESAPDRKLQLAQIYQSIANRFPFFKNLDDKKTAGWQNSIRHNLSLKKMFVRVNKGDGSDDQGGKGGWWTVQPGVPDEGRPGRKAKAKRIKEMESQGGTPSTVPEDDHPEQPSPPVMTEEKPAAQESL